LLARAGATMEFKNQCEQPEEKAMLSTQTISEFAQNEHEEIAWGASLGSLFQQARFRHGSRTAVTFDGESLTYGELSERAERVAAAIQAIGLPQRPLVAIYLERSLDMVCAMVGVIRAGAAYLPLDASYPVARLLDTLVDAQPEAVLTSHTLAAALAGGKMPLVLVEELVKSPGAEDEWARTEPDDLAYVIYTSGSTGRPKGVMVTHLNVMRLFSQSQPWFHFNEHDVWTMFHSFAFDFSVWEMWGCLLSGGRLVLVPFEISRSPKDFRSLLSSERVTVLNQTPSAFSMLIQSDAQGDSLPLALRLVILGGEALNLRSLRPWFQRHGDQRPEIVNMYGITETTVHVTYRRILFGDAEREYESLIGLPLPDLTVHLLDGDFRPVAEGETGEICIGGPGVARGYLHRPELTMERFVADPFGSGGARLYRSGDLARRRRDGELVYLGRADRQVKINGYRIELGEVEAALTSIPTIKQACVVAHPDSSGAHRLAAYYVAEAEAIDSKRIAGTLAESLPAHMRPAFYVRLDALPLTSNGKIDRAALPSPVPAPQPESFETTTEAKLAAVWKQVLGLVSVGAEDNFFDVGGTSLSLIVLRTALQQELGRSIPIMWFFEYTTIRALARKLSEQSILTQTSSSAVPENTRRQRESFARMKAIRSVPR
jgi:amino acid adenylation domain-containing protein